MATAASKLEASDEANRNMSVTGINLVAAQNVRASQVEQRRRSTGRWEQLWWRREIHTAQTAEQEHFGEEHKRVSNLALKMKNGEPACFGEVFF